MLPRPAEWCSGLTVTRLYTHNGVVRFGNLSHTTIEAALLKLQLRDRGIDGAPQCSYTYSRYARVTGSRSRYQEVSGVDHEGLTARLVAGNCDGVYLVKGYPV